MKEVHLAVGVLAIAINVGVVLFGAWEWSRARSSRPFWWALRAGQVAVIVQVALGGILVALGHEPHHLHVLYGALPLLVSLIAEQLRAASAQMVLDSRGIQSPQAVSKLPEVAHGPGERPVDDRHPVLEVVCHLFELLGLGQLGGEKAREVLLLRAQDVEGEAPGFAHDGEGARPILDAHECHQRLE